MNEPVLNELSLEPAPTPTEERLRALQAALFRLDSLGYPKVLRQVRDAIEREVEPGVSLRIFLFKKASKDLKLALLGRLSRPPYVEELHEQQETARSVLLEASLDGLPATGLGVAHLHDVPALALGGTPRWEVDPIRVMLSRTDGDGSVEDRQVDVIHLHRLEQVNRRAEVLRDRILRAVSGGDALWERREVLFPRLEFCEAVERQVRALTGNEFFFMHVVRAFACLDEALLRWEPGPLHPAMDHSPESPTTLNHGTYGPMRNFLCPDGVERQFKNHLKLFSNNWRIYYLESRSGDTEGRAFVGYVGAHLPTVKFPT